MTYTEKVQIQKDVIMGVIPPMGESQEAREFRESIAKDLREAKSKGVILDFPHDWD